MSSILTKQKAGASGLPGGGGFTPVTTFQGASSTSEFDVQDSAGSNLVLPLKAGMLTDRAAVIRIYGRMLGAAGNLTVKLYDGSKSGTLLATSGAVAAADGKVFIEIKCVADPTSDKLMGTIDGFIGGTVITHAVISNGAFDPDIAHNLGLSGTFSSSNSANGLSIRTFEIDIL